MGALFLHLFPRGHLGATEAWFRDSCRSLHVGWPWCGGNCTGDRVRPTRGASAAACKEQLFQLVFRTHSLLSVESHRAWRSHSGAPRPSPPKSCRSTCFLSCSPGWHSTGRRFDPVRLRQLTAHRGSQGRTGVAHEKAAVLRDAPAGIASRRRRALATFEYAASPLPDLRLGLLRDQRGGA